MMKIIGKRKSPVLADKPSGVLLKQGALWNEKMWQSNPKTQTNHIPKGVYRFNTHEEMNKFDEKCIAVGIAKLSE